MRLPIVAVVVIGCSPTPAPAPVVVRPVPVAGLTATRMDFYAPNPAMIGGPWALQITVAGTGFVERAIPLSATVGDVPVEAIMEIGDEFTGYLATLPADGSELSIGYEALQRTGLRYHP